MGQGLLTIDKSLLQKNCNWEYVDLALLLPTSTAQDNTQADSLLAARFSLFPGCEVVRQKRRQINSIADWIQAFIVYTMVIVSEHPAYMLTIIKASQNTLLAVV